MIKRSDDMIREIKEQMRGGMGQVTVKHLFMPEEIHGKARLIAHLTLEPGCSIGFHEHVNEEEVFYALSGEVVLNDEGIDQVLYAGDAAMTLGGQSHSLRNESAAKAEVMAIILLYC